MIDNGDVVCAKTIIKKSAGGAWNMNKNIVADLVFSRDRSGVKNVGLLHKSGAKKPAALNQ
jgi:hypothetical protein